MNFHPTRSMVSPPALLSKIEDHMNLCHHSYIVDSWTVRFYERMAPSRCLRESVCCLLNHACCESKAVNQWCNSDGLCKHSVDIVGHHSPDKACQFSGNGSSCFVICFPIPHDKCVEPLSKPFIAFIRIRNHCLCIAFLPFCYYVNKVDNLNRGDSTEIGILILKWR